MAQYFYSPGHQRVDEELVDNCRVCCSLKFLPKELMMEETTLSGNLGQNWSCDFIKRSSQLIMIAREKLTQYLVSAFLENETAEAMKETLFSLIIRFTPSSGAVVQVDPAPGWSKLQTDYQNSLYDVFNRENIKLDMTGWTT